MNTKHRDKKSWDKDHQEIEELIPWYVNGTLNEVDMNRVNTHLLDCKACAQTLSDETTIAQRINSEPAELESLLADKNTLLSRLQIRLHRSEQRRLWRLTIPQAAAVVLCSVLLGFLGGTIAPDTHYTTLTNAPSNTGSVLQVMFKPTTTEREFRQLLLDGDAQLLTSPSLKGVYRLQLPEDVDGAGYANRLQQHPAVVYAELELH